MAPEGFKAVRGAAGCRGSQARESGGREQFGTPAKTPLRDASLTGVSVEGEIAEAELTFFRAATNRGFVPGSERFQKQIAAMVGRRI